MRACCEGLVLSSWKKAIKDCRAKMSGPPLGCESRIVRGLLGAGPRTPPSNLRRLPSGKKKEPKPKLFGPDLFQWGRGLPRERVGAKKFDMSLETQGIKLFGRDIPGFCRDIPGVPEKFEKKKFVFNFRSLFPSSGVDMALIQYRSDIDSTSIS